MSDIFFCELQDLLDVNQDGPQDNSQAPIASGSGLNNPGIIQLSKSDLKEMINSAVNAALGASSDTDDEEPVPKGSDCLDDEILTSPDVSEAILLTIKHRLKEKMPMEVLSKKRECYKTLPGNMTFMKATRVNPELWDALNTYAKSSDRKYKKIGRFNVVSIKTTHLDR